MSSTPNSDSYLTSTAPKSEPADDASQVEDQLTGRGRPPARKRQANPEQQPQGQKKRRRTTLPRNTRRWSRGIVWSLIGLTSFCAVYGSLARIETSVSATGELRPTNGVVSVTVPFNTLVEKVHVREGDLVKAGQPLLRVRASSVQAQLKNVRRMEQLWRKETNLLALQLGQPALPPRTKVTRDQLATDINEVRVRELSARKEKERAIINLRQQQSDLEEMRNRYKLNQGISARMRRLISQGAMAQIELDRQEERQMELRAAIRRTAEEVKSALKRIGESEFKQFQIPLANRKLLYSQLDNARQQYFEAANRINDLEERIKLGALVAPAAGRVFDLNVKSGELATLARPVLKLVSQGRLEVDLSVSNRDIGFLEPGMPVDVRVTSFPFTDYGALKGTIKRISADSLPPDQQNPQDHFPIQVTVNSNSLSKDGKVYPLRAGMAVTALIQLGSRPVIALISDRFGGFIESTRSIR